MEMKKMLIFASVLLVGIMMFSLVMGAGYNIVVPSDDDSNDDTGGSSGSSSSTTTTTGLTYAVTDAQFILGYTKEISLNDRFRVSVGDELHHVQFVEVTATTATINVSSETQQATLEIGETKNFDVNADDNYDLSVKLNSINITSSKADFTVMVASGEVIVELDETEENEGVVEKGIGEVGKIIEKIGWKAIVAVLGVLALVSGAVWYFLKDKRKRFIEIRTKKKK